MDNLETFDFVIIGVNVIYLAALVYLIKATVNFKRIIKGIRANIPANIVERDVIDDWTAKAEKHGPNTNLGRAYRKRLIEVEHPYRGD